MFPEPALFTTLLLGHSLGAPSRCVFFYISGTISWNDACETLPQEEVTRGWYEDKAEKNWVHV